MSAFKAISKIFLVMLSMMTIASGCATKRVAIVVSDPTCSDILSGGVSNFSPAQLEEILDNAVFEEQIENCWIPVMKSCLEERQDIPLKHLAKAVKVFNQQRHEKIFHIAIYRYFSAIAKGEGRYREQDRKLLEAYCSYMINNAGSREDKNLCQAMLLCKNLDQEMYARLFE